MYYVSYQCGPDERIYADAIEILTEEEGLSLIEEHGCREWIEDGICYAVDDYPDKGSVLSWYENNAIGRGQFPPVFPD